MSYKTPSHPMPRATKKAFTLIELLVVIAIIAILAAILFPVFGRARESARRSSCQSNMKQIGLGMQQYQQDYDERVVPYRNAVPNPYSNAANDPFLGTSGTPSTRTASFMNVLLDPYIKSEQIWLCPSNPDAWVNVDRRSSSDTDPGFRSYGGQNSYGVNNYAMKSNNGPSIASFPETANTVALIDAKYYNVLPRNACKLVGDSFNPITAPTPVGIYLKYWRSLGNSFQFRFTGGAANEPTDAEAEQLGRGRHLETLNTLFLDGHVKAINYGKISTDAPAIGDADSVWDPFKQGCE